MKLTKEILQRGKSRRGGWSQNQLRVFGCHTFYAGWIKDILYKDFPEEKINQFLALKDGHLKKKNHSDTSQLSIDL